MLVVKASHMGMCFGVKDALDYARGLTRPENVTIYGELVHNPQVKGELQRRGFRQTSETSREQMPRTEEVMITAHGVSDQVRQALGAAGHRLHDTTCPLVRRVHKAALHYHRQGYFMVVIGKSGHVEVEGLIGDLQRFLVVESEEQVHAWDEPKIAVVNQTTYRPEQLARVHRRIRALNSDSEVVFVDTVCRPTRDRQQAIEELIGRVEALVVVGGRNSNNTRQLGLQAEQRGKPWLHVESADEISDGWFSGLRVVGLSAGTSTPDEVIDEVYRRLVRIGNRVSA